jgi:MFS transporter, putative metabolite:H+ symporter
MQEIAQPAVESELSRLHVMAATACGVALAVDMIEMTIGNAFSTVFIAAPYSMAPRQLSFLIASVYLGAVLGAPLFGWAAGRHGIRRCLVATLLWLGLTSFAAAATPDIAWLGELRFLSGLALGAIPPLLIAYLTQMAPPQRRGFLIFWVCGLAALAPPAALMGIRWLLPLEPWGIASWRWPLAAAGALSLLAGWWFTRLPEATEWRDTSANMAAPMGAGVTAASSTGLGRLGLVSVVYFMLPWASVGFPLLTGPILLLRGFDVRQALLYVALTTIGPTLASLITGAFVDRIERRITLAACAAVMFATVAVFAFARSALWVGAALVIFGVAAAVYVTALTMYAAEIFPSRTRTFATSFAWSCNRGAAVIVPVVLLALITPRDSFHSLLPIGIAIVLSLVLVCCGPAGAAGRVVD